MKIKALSSIIEFDNGQMVVINEGETGELSDAKAEQYIRAGQARAVKTKAPTAAQLAAAEAEAAALADAEAAAAAEAEAAALADAEAADGNGEGSAAADEAPAE